MCTHINVILDMFCFLMINDLGPHYKQYKLDEYNGILSTIVEKVYSWHVNSYGAFLCEIELAEKCPILSGVLRTTTLSIHPSLWSARKMGTKCFKGPWLGKQVLGISIIQSILRDILMMEPRGKLCFTLRIIIICFGRLMGIDIELCFIC